MITISNDDILEKALDNIIESKYFKVTQVVVIAVISVYLLGHIFKISAHTVRGFNELKSAIKNG